MEREGQSDRFGRSSWSGACIHEPHPLFSQSMSHTHLAAEVMHRAVNE